MAKERYDEAILIATLQLEQALSEEQIAEFKQQLADQLFNRALFLLRVAEKMLICMLLATGNVGSRASLPTR